MSPELEHPTTKHLAQILGNKIPRIFRTHEHTRDAHTRPGVEELPAEDIEVPACVPWIIVSLARTTPRNYNAAVYKRVGVFGCNLFEATP